MMTFHEDLARIGKELMFKEQFYALFLITLNKVINNSIPTAGVCKKGINCELAINEDFWWSLPDNQKVGVLKHELMHIAFMHLTLRDRYANKELFNIAADLEINQYVGAKNLPNGAMLIESFAAQGIVLNKFAGTQYYYEELDKNKNNSYVKGLLSQFPNGNSPSQHSTWDEFAEGTDAEKELVEKQIEYQLKEAANNVKDRGTIPGEFKSLIDALFKIKAASFDWKAYLRRFLGNSNKVYTKKSRKKLNKRFPGNPAIKIKTKNHILIGVDTSGSVSDKELADIFSEIYHVWKQGDMVTVAQFDAHVHSVAEYKGKFDGRIVGRGGTHFQPIIDFYDNAKGKYTTLIVATDSYAPCPTKPRGSMLWLMTSSARELESYKDWPGYKIKIPKDVDK